jgi:hypothetical protein
MHQIQMAVRGVMVDLTQPVVPSQIVDEVNEALVGFSTSVEVIANLIDELPEYEVADVDGVDCYQIRIGALKDAGRMGIRVLYEEGEPMHINDIVEQITLWLEAEGLEETVRHDALQAAFCKTDRVVALGRTGKWALAEWGVEYRTVIQLVQEVLRVNGGPMTKEEIVRLVQARKSEVNVATVNRTLRHETRSFIPLPDGRFDLVENR